MADSNYVTNPAGTPAAGGSISLDDVVDKMKGLVANVDKVTNEELDALKKEGAAEAGKINPAHLANVQHALNKWSITYNLAATTNRTVKDLMSGIVQKI